MSSSKSKKRMKRSKSTPNLSMSTILDPITDPSKIIDRRSAHKLSRFIKNRHILAYLIHPRRLLKRTIVLPSKQDVQHPKNYKPKKTKLRSNNTTGYPGVRKKGKKFQARIRIRSIHRLREDDSLTTLGTIKLPSKQIFQDLI